MLTTVRHAVLVVCGLLVLWVAVMSGLWLIAKAIPIVQAQEQPAPSPQPGVTALSELDQLRARIVRLEADVIERDRQIGQLLTENANLRMGRVNANAEALGRELLGKLGGGEGDTFDWTTLTLRKRDATPK